MRIRSVKPEFFDSPSTAAAGPWARLLFIAMWCMADDWGVGSANPKELAASAFPNDEQWTSKEVPCLCKEVADSFGVVFYTHRGRRYFQIPSWEDHQITQRRAKRRYPTADDPESVIDKGEHRTDKESPCRSKEVPWQSKEIASTEREQGSMEQGTGDSTTSGGEPPASDGDPEPDPEPSAALVVNGENAQSLIGEWLDHTDPRPPGRVIGQVSREIKSMLDEGQPFADVRAGLAAWARKGLHPSTLASVVHGERTRKFNPTSNITNGVDWDAAMARAAERDRDQEAS